MFRIILLIFIFLYFNGNFFYGLTFSYIPFKNAQWVNIYNMYKIFEEPSFQTFMNEWTLTGSTYNIKGVWTIWLEKTSWTGLILKLPYKINHRFGNQVEILIPIIPDTGNLEQNDTIFNELQIVHNNHFINNGNSYLDFWINYNTIENKEQLNSISQKNIKTLYLNKLYLIKKIQPPNNIFLLR